MTTEPDTTEAGTFTLPPRLDTDTAPELREDLIAQRGLNLALNAEDVTHLGARCLAVLIAAANTWREDDKTLSLAGASDAFDAGLARMGCPADLLTSEGASS